ncbi:MAG: hypothetical protein SPF99_10325 [Anaerobutyricum sp.]|nr:hypothetical protein [Anaerobutyricum sp.]
MEKQQKSQFDWLPGFQEMTACQEEKEETETMQDLLAPERLQKEEQEYWKDYEYFLQKMPFMAREIWAVADALLDRYEYAGSSLYVPYPDEVTILKIADMVYDKLKYHETEPDMQNGDGSREANPYYVKEELRDSRTPFRNLIVVILYGTIAYRRQRYQRRQKVFHNR